MTNTIGMESGDGGNGRLEILAPPPRTLSSAKVAPMQKTHQEKVEAGTLEGGSWTTENWKMGKQKLENRLQVTTQYLKMQTTSHGNSATANKMLFFACGFLPCALLSAVTSYFSQTNHKDKDSIVLGLSCANALFAGVAAYWNWGEIAEKHRVASKSYRSLGFKAAAISLQWDTIASKFHGKMALHDKHQKEVNDAYEKAWNELYELKKFEKKIAADAPSPSYLHRKLMDKQEKEIKAKEESEEEKDAAGNLLQRCEQLPQLRDAEAHDLTELRNAAGNLLQRFEQLPQLRGPEALDLTELRNATGGLLRLCEQLPKPGTPPTTPPTSPPTLR